eukprot:scaffold17853_cov67-Isochrysis_galbana.AAC.1
MPDVTVGRWALVCGPVLFWCDVPTCVSIRARDDLRLPSPSQPSSSTLPARPSPPVSSRGGTPFTMLSALTRQARARTRRGSIST